MFPSVLFTLQYTVVVQLVVHLVVERWFIKEVPVRERETLSLKVRPAAASLNPLEKYVEVSNVTTK